MTDRMRIFDRELVRRRRARLGRHLATAGFLVAEVAERLLERLDDVRRSFPKALVLGGHRGALSRGLAARAGIETVVTVDPLGMMLEGEPGLRLVGDEEALPLAADSVDLALSVMHLHWVNDLPGTLVQVRRSLTPDGLLLAALPGNDTLFELRQALMQAELECEGGVSPRVSPFLDVRDAGMLLQRAGFALPVVDVDRIRVSYADPLQLMRELARMGESNALLERRKGPLKRWTLVRACEIYRERFGDADGRVPATFDMLFLSAWKPHESQPKPLRRGSGRIDLAQALGVPPGEKGGSGAA